MNFSEALAKSLTAVAILLICHAVILLIIYLIKKLSYLIKPSLYDASDFLEDIAYNIVRLGKSIVWRIINVEYNSDAYFGIKSDR